MPTFLIFDFDETFTDSVATCRLSCHPEHEFCQYWRIVNSHKAIFIPPQPAVVEFFSSEGNFLIVNANFPQKVIKYSCHSCFKCPFPVIYSTDQEFANGWSKTLKRFVEKYCLQIFVKNVVLAGKKACWTSLWNLNTHKQITACLKNTSKYFFSQGCSSLW